MMVYVVLTPPNAYDPVVVIFVTVALTAFPYLFCRFVLDLARKRAGAGILAPRLLGTGPGAGHGYFFRIPSV